jgi:hypothetical protein
MAMDGEWIPITLFFAIVAIVGIVMYYKNERTKAESSGGGDYKRLADEAVRGQRVLLEEMQRMNQTLKEIERLLREV